MIKATINLINYCFHQLIDLTCRSCVRLAIRKIMYAPSKQGEQPSVEVSKEFMMSPNKLHLEASLDKELYHHGENIAVNVHIANNSNRTVKKIKVSVRQFADICLFSTAQYKCTVAEAESEWVFSSRLFFPSLTEELRYSTLAGEIKFNLNSLLFLGIKSNFSKHTDTFFSHF